MKGSTGMEKAKKNISVSVKKLKAFHGGIETYLSFDTHSPYYSSHNVIFFSLYCCSVHLNLVLIITVVVIISFYTSVAFALGPELLFTWEETVYWKICKVKKKSEFL